MGLKFISYVFIASFIIFSINISNAADLSVLAQQNFPMVVRIQSKIVITNAVSQLHLSDILPRLPPGHPAPDSNDEDNDHTPQVGEGLGTGFLYNGYVITNNHVIENAYKINVFLNDKTEHPAKLVGTDRRTDIAVLQIDIKTLPIPSIQFGDSDVLKVGEGVMAIGNPFGLGYTVTSGIISAKNRDIKSGPYDDYLQTDAPINKGNSGGPLFNMQGQVIGMNTAIFSESGGSVGLGFAIPSNEVKKIAEILIKNGYVERAKIGINYQDTDELMARALGVPNNHYPFVLGVAQDGPSKDKFMEGDIITSIDGIELKGKDLAELMANKHPNDLVTVTFIRNGETKNDQVTLGSFKEIETMPAPPHYTQDRDTLGMVLKPLTSDFRSSAHISSSIDGLLIEKVEPGEAREQRIGEGILTHIDGKPITTVDGAKQAIKEGKTKGAILLRIIDPQGTVQFAAVEDKWPLDEPPGHL